MRYTEEEDEIILNCVQRNIGNIKRGCEEASSLINRNSVNIQNHYYTKLKGSNAVFMTVSKNRCLKNSKISTKNNNAIEIKSNSIWKKLINLFKKITLN